MEKLKKMKTYIIDFHGTLVKDYDMEYKFYQEIFANKSVKIKAELFLRLVGMYIHKKKDDLSEIYNVFEDCLNTLNLKEDEVEKCMNNSAGKFSVPEDVDHTLKNLENKIIISRGIENLIKIALKDYKISIYGNLLERVNSWKIRRDIMKASDKLKKLKEICKKEDLGKLIVLGNGNSDIEILKYADVPVVTYNAPKQIKKMVMEKNGLILKKGKFDKMLDL
ncbi:MAG: HAD hydrolase family protein [Candidatus Altarchaeum sp.]|nr:HAD hydrolase family protein [Candidatus Altarchaeum sp.]